MRLNSIYGNFFNSLFYDLILTLFYLITKSDQYCMYIVHTSGSTSSYSSVFICVR